MDLHAEALVTMSEMQSRIMTQVAAAGVMSGTLLSLADRFGTTPDELRVCLRHLDSDGLIAVQTHPHGYLGIRIERRVSSWDSRRRNRRRFQPEMWRL